VTPFGKKMRILRLSTGVSLKQLAQDLQLSASYLSSLERGHRGRPSEALVVQICEYFNLIWDDFEEMKRLASLSHPRAVVDTRGMGHKHTELANQLALSIGTLSESEVEEVLRYLRRFQLKNQ
jgi:transcriptional regulator with XRE-family HTH domain|tara:strand:- start:10647 stop:11015 length:369 start_codon:yes stop_codon:yes gene_type:complete